MTPMEYSLGMCPPPPEEGGKGKRNGRSPQSKTEKKIIINTIEKKTKWISKHERNMKLIV